jgi:hypothetical protein
MRSLKPLVYKGFRGRKSRRNVHFLGDNIMAKIQLIYDIDNCSRCPLHRTQPLITSDSWEHASDYYCGSNGKKIAGYIEWESDMPNIPNWCPHLLKEKEGD